MSDDNSEILQAAEPRFKTLDHKLERTFSVL